MIFFPRSSEVIGNLNSYYIYLSKLIEHYQGFLNSGCIYFKSPSSEGAIYFDDENIINGILIEKNKVIREQDAVDSLIENSDSKNYSITIYDISQDMITYWANLYESNLVNKSLLNSMSEFDSLLIQYQKEKLTGYIEIKSHDDGSNYFLFLLAGNIFLSACKENKYNLSDGAFVLTILKTKYTDNKVNLTIAIKSTSLTQKSYVNRYKVSSVHNENDEIIEVKNKPLKFIDMLQSLMIIYEKYFINKKSNDLFDKLLKKKFIEKVDKYIFLDPFAAEFSYSQGKISFFGTESHQVLAESLIECLNEICFENDMKSWLKKHLSSFEDKYANELSKINNKIISA